MNPGSRVSFTLIELLVVTPIRKAFHAFIRGKSPSSSPRASFTLIELLVVIAILAVLATAVVLVLNPAQLLAQGRDSTRLSDLSALNSALSLFQADQYTQSLGTPNTLYISVPDTTSTCANLGLSSPPIGWAYHCVPSSSSTRVDGTGWIPVNLTLLSSGSPLSKLPIDPVNTTSTGFYYTYVSGGSYALSSALESQKYLSSTASQDQGYDPGKYEIGSDLSLIGRSEGLVGWWPLDGSPNDQSGNNNNGTWFGSMIGGSYYTGGKINQAGNFNGTDDYVSVGNSPIFDMGTGNMTISAWLSSYTDPSNYGNVVGKISWNGVLGYGIVNAYDTGTNCVMGYMAKNGISDRVVNDSTAYCPSSGSWHLYTTVFNRVSNTLALYVDGSLVNSKSIAGYSGVGFTNTAAVTIGVYDNNYLKSNIDDVRIYNRTLSAAEIQAIYNAQK